MTRFTLLQLDDPIESQKLSYIPAVVEFQPADLLTRFPEFRAPVPLFRKLQDARRYCADIPSCNKMP